MLNLGLDYEFVEAIDGRLLNDKKGRLRSLVSDKYAFRCGGRPLTNAEFGCALSHLFVYQTIVNRKIPYAIILEDDVSLGLAFDLFVKNLIQIQKLDWELINLVSKTPSIPYGEIVFDIYRFSKFTEASNGAGAYCLKLSAAEKLLGYAYPVRFSADDLIGNSMDIGVNLCGILPEFVAWNDAFQSEIGSRHFHVSILSKQTKYPNSRYLCD